MQKVLSKISDDMDSKNINRTQLVKRIDIDGATLSRFLKGKHQLVFNKYGIILKEVYPDDVNARRSFCRKYSSVLKRQGNKKIAVYYLLAHGELDTVAELLNETTIKHDWEKVCRLIYLRYKGDLSGDGLLKVYKEKVEGIKSKNVEFEILKGIVLLHIRYDQKNYKSMIRLSEELHEKVEELEDNYAKEFLKFKIQEATIYGLLTCNEIPRLRSVCHEIINDESSDMLFPIFKATAYGVLGESYIFTDYHKSLGYLNAAASIITNGPGDQMMKRKNMILNTIDFLKIHWKIDLDNINPKDEVEKAYLEIQKGNCEKAISILEDVIKDKGKLSAFGLTYLGIAKGNDPQILSDALDLFERSSDIFYSYLAKKNLGIMSQKCYNLVG
ncbi:AimR family lysis-lysogeny pheromone receptor [Bacillus sp. FSL W8-0519]|uniref:AimR family lysis-lysogeny pheromone receptor n=1 Tax=Bacillus TaxID=1386 RepID=UPI001E3A5051|nr:AimR family lysis-lysogeny pheromone receptor [Bacillus paranthracis]MCC2414008.1 AimR family lysis-lysogeny pheromone receptor [Bacillus paranthracis]